MAADDRQPCQWEQVTAFEELLDKHRDVRHRIDAMPDDVARMDEMGVAQRERQALESSLKVLAATPYAVGDGDSETVLEYAARAAEDKGQQEAARSLVEQWEEVNKGVSLKTLLGRSVLSVKDTLKRMPVGEKKRLFLNEHSEGKTALEELLSSMRTQEDHQKALLLLSEKQALGLREGLDDELMAVLLSADQHLRETGIAVFGPVVRQEREQKFSKRAIEELVLFADKQASEVIAKRFREAIARWLFIMESQDDSYLKTDEQRNKYAIKQRFDVKNYLRFEKDFGITGLAVGSLMIIPTLFIALRTAVFSTVAGKAVLAVGIAMLVVAAVCGVSAIVKTVKRKQTMKRARSLFDEKRALPKKDPEEGSDASHTNH